MRSMSKSIFIRRERGAWSALQRHWAVLLRSNEQLAWRIIEVVDMMSRCEGLKEEGATDREEVHRLRDKVHGLKVEVDRHEGELRQAQDCFQVVASSKTRLPSTLTRSPSP
jgi:predicted  nucleic acid-binding Zn-ribbon protein